MKPGRELDALIAEKVMGLHEFCSYAGKSKASLGWGKNGADFFKGEISALPSYSTNIASAWEIVEKLQSLRKSVRVYNQGIVSETTDLYSCEIENRYYEGEPDTWFSGWVESAPHAICLAALKAMGVEV